MGFQDAKKKPEHPRRKWIGSEILFVSKMWQQPSSVHNSKQHPFLGGSTTQGFWHQYPSWLVLIWVNLRCRHTCANTLARDRYCTKTSVQVLQVAPDVIVPVWILDDPLVCQDGLLQLYLLIVRKSLLELQAGFMTIFVSLFTTCICMDICCSTDHITSQQREDVEKSRGSRSDFPTIKR